MRRKPHLDERLVSCGDIITLADMSEKNMSVAARVPEYLDFAGIFGNGNPVRLEVGCGKGRFVLESAKAEPDVNFVAVDKISNVIVTACEEAVAEGVRNVHFINTAAEVLPKYFPQGSAERIYLNFPNPLTKKGYSRQRLTNPRFLAIYRDILVPGGEIWLKTDDGYFFDYSLEALSGCGFALRDVCRDITREPVEGNVITEHERLFMDRGLPIFRAVAVRG